MAPCLFTLLGIHRRHFGKSHVVLAILSLDAVPSPLFLVLMQTYGCILLICEDPVEQDYLPQLSVPALD